MESREGGNFLLYRIFFMFWFFFIFLLVSCSEDGIVHDKEEIFYMPELSCETRGFFLDNNSIMDFGVYSSLGSSSVEFEEDESLHPFMDNVRISRVGSIWKSDVPYYWPVDKDLDVTFFAYAPFLSERDGMSAYADWTEGRVVYNYTPSTNPARQKDLLIARPRKDLHGEVVDFNFEHALTWVEFLVNYTEGEGPVKLPEGTYLRIDKIEIKGLLGTNSLICDAEGFEWDDPISVASAEYGLSYVGLTLSDVFLEKSEYKSVVSNDGIMFLLPQVVDDNAVTLCVTFSFVDSITKEVVSQFYSERFINGHELEMGRKVFYKFTVDISTTSLVKVAPVDGGTWIEQWTPSDNDTISYPII